MTEAIVKFKMVLGADGYDTFSGVTINGIVNVHQLSELLGSEEFLEGLIENPKKNRVYVIEIKLPTDKLGWPEYKKTYEIVSASFDKEATMAMLKSNKEMEEMWERCYSQRGM